MQFYSEKITTLPPDWVRERVEDFLREDLPSGDVTSTAIVDEQLRGTARIEAVERLIFAGAQVLPVCCGPECGLELQATDGAVVPAGGLIAIVQGPARLILARERVTLNLLQRLSGIATLTSRYVEIAAPHGVHVLDTRKTTPGLRLFEKYAVTVGGGRNHRLDLSSGILIKDNHLQLAGSISAAVSAVRAAGGNLPVEVEVETRKQLLEGLAAEVDAFLLDNIAPIQVAELVSLVRDHPRGGEIFVEASGGITLDNLEAYARTGVDGISVGALTHSVRSVDIRMELAT
ncbi:MAG: carboxylating nicotinate-nucleotide diphosphorylase [Candidatus Neomarinimicrobiota bacterium]